MTYYQTGISPSAVYAKQFSTRSQALGSYPLQFRANSKLGACHHRYGTNGVNVLWILALTLEGTVSFLQFRNFFCARA
jgi:hypothetical protein